MIKNHLKSSALAAVFIISSAAGFAQGKKNTSVPVEISVEGSGTGFASLNSGVFKAAFVESLEKKTVYNLHVVETGEKPALKMVLRLADFDLLGPNEQNTMKNVTRRVQVGVDKNGNPIYENRVTQENVVTYQVQASTKLGVAVGAEEALTQVVGPDVQRRYKYRPQPGTSTSPERVTAENILLDMFQSHDWLLIRNQVDKVLKSSEVASQPSRH